MRDFPELHADINRVCEEESFTVPDLQWIAKCMGCLIRCTVDPDTHATILDTEGGEMPADALYGTPGRSADAHLYFRYQETTGGSGRLVGHFDLLRPTSKTLFAKLLPKDVSRAWCKAFFLYMPLYIEGTVL